MTIHGHIGSQKCWWTCFFPYIYTPGKKTDN